MSGIAAILLLPRRNATADVLQAQILAVAVDNQHMLLVEEVRNLQLRLQYVFSALQKFYVRRPHIGNHSQVGPHDIRQQPDFPKAAHAHFKYSDLGVFFHLKYGQRKPQLVVEISFIAYGLISAR